MQLDFLAASNVERKAYEANILRNETIYGLNEIILTKSDFT